VSSAAKAAEWLANAKEAIEAQAAAARDAANRVAAWLAAKAQAAGSAARQLATAAAATAKDVGAQIAKGAETAAIAVGAAIILAKDAVVAAGKATAAMAVAALAAAKLACAKAHDAAEAVRFLLLFSVGRRRSLSSEMCNRRTTPLSQRPARSPLRLLPRRRRPRTPSERPRLLSPPLPKTPRTSPSESSL
jgi:hypothetical protein